MLDLARFMANAGAMSAFGALLYSASIAATPRAWANASAVLGLAGLASWASLAFDAPLTDVLAHTWFGHVAIARFVLLALAMATPRRLAPLPAGASLAAGALHGHAMAMGDDPALVACEALHLLAAGAWLGGLVPLAITLSPAHARRFFALGLPCVLIIAATALWQGWVLGGGLPGLFGTPYGALLAGKAALFLTLAGLAAWHHWRRIARRSIAFEAGLGAATILLAAILANSSPGMHTQPSWPFPWRPTLEAWNDPDLRRDILHGGLDLFFVPAYPTSYATSPDEPSPASIARGIDLFARHCAACHGPDGRGTNEANNLLAPHLWDHLPGELFWWISHGIPNPEGGNWMPGFADVLTEADRWALIDALYARNPYGAGTAVHHHH